MIGGSWELWLLAASLTILGLAFVVSQISPDEVPPELDERCLSCQLCECRRIRQW